MMSAYWRISEDCSKVAREGMIVTQGGRFGGYGLYLLKGKPVFLWNLVDLIIIVSIVFAITD
jgi:hypothetical protein